MFHLFIILFCSFILFLDVFSLRFNNQKSERKKKDLKNKLDHLKYRTHMIESFQKNTLLCSCGNLMKCEYT